MPLWDILTISRDCAPTFLGNNSKEMSFTYCQTWFQVIMFKSVYYFVWTLSISEGGWWFVFCFPQWNQFNFQDYPNSVFWEREIITNKSASYCFLNVIFIFQTIFFLILTGWCYLGGILFSWIFTVCTSVIPLKHKTKMKLGRWPHTCNFSSHEVKAGGPQSGLG